MSHWWNEGTTRKKGTLHNFSFALVQVQLMMVELNFFVRKISLMFMVFIYPASQKYLVVAVHVAVVAVVLDD